MPSMLKDFMERARPLARRRPADVLMGRIFQKTVDQNGTVTTTTVTANMTQLDIMAREAHNITGDLEKLLSDLNASIIASRGQGKDTLVLRSRRLDLIRIQNVITGADRMHPFSIRELTHNMTEVACVYQTASLVERQLVRIEKARDVRPRFR